MPGEVVDGHRRAERGHLPFQGIGVGQNVRREHSVGHRREKDLLAPNPVEIATRRHRDPTNPARKPAAHAKPLPAPV
jgi:hypothetical protein